MSELLNDEILTAVCQSLIDTNDVRVRGRCIGRLVNHIKALTAQLAAAERDARRYRWLRDPYKRDIAAQILLDKMDCDAAIDSALTSSRGTG